MLFNRQLFGHRLNSFVFTAILILAFVGIVTVSTDEDDIPTDIDTWNKCCHHDDCVQGKVTITDIQGNLFWIEFNGGPEFFVNKQIVHPSSNGKEYVCWLEHVTDDMGNVIGRPTNENVLCVFKLYHMAKLK